MSDLTCAPPSPSSSLQYEFIAADFAAVNRTETPWLVLIGHRPMYYDCCGSILCDIAQKDSQHMRGVLEG